MSPGTFFSAVNFVRGLVIGIILGLGYVNLFSGISASYCLGMAASELRNSPFLNPSISQIMLSYNSKVRVFMNERNCNVGLRAEPSTFKMYVAPIVIAAMVSALFTGCVGNLIWTRDGKTYFVLMFLMFLVPMGLLFIQYNRWYSRWSIDGGVVYRGGYPLFRLDEIEAAQIGLPDNLVTALAKIPGIRFTRARVLLRLAEWQKEMLVIRLANSRWFIWSGLEYDNGYEFREHLRFVAPRKTIEHFPPAIRGRLTPTHGNRIMQE